jgi:hypothetical protein
MKKNYILSALFAFIMTGMNAQFTDDIESYANGAPVDGDWWLEWVTGIGYATSSDAQSVSGTQSALVGGDGVDPVLDLGNKIFGTWYLTFQMYVPSGKEAYMNIQGVTPIGSGEWVIGNWFFNQALGSPGVGQIDNSALGAVSFDFPHDEWFEVQVNVDISAGISLATIEIKVDGVDVLPAGTAFTDSAGTVPTGLGGVNIYSISANNEVYFDDYVYSDSNVGTQDFAATGFQAYPNPVNNVLNLQANEAISNVAIFNVLGQEVYRADINAMTSQVDMSQMASGAYFVKVNINGTEGTVKVIK